MARRTFQLSRSVTVFTDAGSISYVADAASIGVKRSSFQTCLHRLVKAYITSRRLLRGPWLAKVYLDRHDRQASDANYELGPADHVGDVELNSDWPPGYQPPQIMQFPRTRNPNLESRSPNP